MTHPLTLLTQLVMSLQDSADGPAPVNLLLNPPPPPEPISPIFIFTAIGTAIILIAAAWQLWRKSPPEEPARRAFRRLAGALGLTISDRRLLLRLSREPNTPPPAALLICESALAALVARLLTSARLDDADAARRILARLRAG